VPNLQKRTPSDCFSFKELFLTLIFFYYHRNSVAESSSSSRTSHTTTHYSSHRKLVHEELALQWAVSMPPYKERAMDHAWFYFTIMVSILNLLTMTEGKIA